MPQPSRRTRNGPGFGKHLHAGLRLRPGKDQLVATGARDLASIAICLLLCIALQGKGQKPGTCLAPFIPLRSACYIMPKLIVTPLPVT